MFFFSFYSINNVNKDVMLTLSSAFLTFISVIKMVCTTCSALQRVHWQLRYTLGRMYKYCLPLWRVLVQPAHFDDRGELWGGVIPGGRSCGGQVDAVLAARDSAVILNPWVAPERVTHVTGRETAERLKHDWSVYSDCPLNLNLNFIHYTKAGCDQIELTAVASLFSVEVRNKATVTFNPTLNMSF